MDQSNAPITATEARRKQIEEQITAAMLAPRVTTPTLAHIWLNRSAYYSELRVDFSNDRHHAVVTEAPYDREAVARAFAATRRWLPARKSHDPLRRSL